MPFNRAHRGALLGDQIRRARVSLLVTDVAALADLPDLASLGVRHLVLVDHDSEDVQGVETLAYRAVQETTRWSGVTPSPSALGTIMFSSGSTGRSKAVKLPHNQLFRGAIHLAEAMHLRSDDVVHEWLPHFHMMGALYALLAPLAAGSTVDFYPRFSSSQFWQEVHEGQASVIAGLANLMRAISDLADEDTIAKNPVRLALIAGTDEKMKRDFANRFSVRVLDFYGMTEAEPITVSTLDGDEPPGSHGRPTADFDVAVVDDEGVPVAVREIGEIVCRPRIPDVLFQGYEEDADSTVVAWKDLWFHTGDRGYLDETEALFFLGRGTISIRRSGENISVLELEQITGRFPGVAIAIAVGIPVGGGEDDVKLVVMPETGSSVDPLELHRWCRQQMAGFMVPRYIEITDTLPTFGIGKIDRDALCRTDRTVWDAESETTRT